MSNLSAEQMAMINRAISVSSNQDDMIFQKPSKLIAYATSAATLMAVSIGTVSLLSTAALTLSMSGNTEMVAISGITSLLSLGAAYLGAHISGSSALNISLSDYEKTFKALEVFGINSEKIIYQDLDLDGAIAHFKSIMEKNSDDLSMIKFIESVHKLSIDTSGIESIDRDRLIKAAQETIFRSQQLAELKSSWLDKVKNVALGLMGATALAAAGMGLSSNANAAQVVIDTPAQTYEAVSSKASVFANDQDIAQEMMIETIKKMIKSSLSSPNDQALVEKGFGEMINNGMLDNALTLNDQKQLILDTQVVADNLPDSYAKTLADSNSDEKIVSLVAGVIAQTIQSDLGADNKLEQKIAQVLADHQSQQKPDDQQSIAKQGQQLAQDFAKYSPEIKDASLSM